MSPSLDRESEKGVERKRERGEGERGMKRRIGRDRERGGKRERGIEREGGEREGAEEGERQ